MDLQDVPPEPDSGGTEESALKGIKWRQLRKSGSMLFPSSSPLGKPTTFTGSTNYLIVGTYSADIVIFDYNQEPLMQLSARSSTDEMLGVVSSIGITEDESHLVVGFGLGAVGLWEIQVSQKSGKLTSLVLPSERGLVHGNGLNKYATNETHLNGVPVISCGILKIGAVKTFVSIDAAGVVIRHKLKRLMFESSTRSVRVLGDPAKGRSILDCASQDNILALLTNKSLLIVKLGRSSTDELFETLLKIPRSRDTAALHKIVDNGCVSLLKTASQQSPLAMYSWNNDLKLIDLALTQAIAAYQHPTSIEHLEFISRDLVVFAADKEVHTVSLMGDSPYSDSHHGFTNSNQLVLSSSAPPIVQSKILFQSIFILGPYDFQVGQLSNWADQLLGLLNAGDPGKAIQLGLDFYHHSGDLSIIGLPLNEKKRKAVIKQALPESVMTALKFSIQFDPDSLRIMMPQALRAIVSIDTNSLDTVAELVEDHVESSEIFYNELASLVRQKHVTKIPPSVLKQLSTLHPEPVSFYNLDLINSDLDLAFHLCEMYKPALDDVKIHSDIEALHDYLSPLMSDEFSDEAQFRYSKLILTSRVYPTEAESLPHSEASHAKELIYNTLFFQENPYYMTLVEKNEKMFFETLHLAFEDPWLNENSEINRQIIMSFLLVHVSSDSPYFCSFIAQNSSKYPQYLAISENILQRVLHSLCHNAPGKDAAQLDVLSSSSSYKPRDISKVIKELSDARYTMVLKHILGRSKKYLELAEIELSIQEPSVWETLDQSFANDKSGTRLFVQTQFDRSAAADIGKLGSLVVRHKVEGVWDHKSVNLDFLRSVFREINNTGGSLPPISVRSEYIRLLAEKRSSDESMWALTNVLTGTHDVELPMVVDCLSANNHVNALTMLLRRSGRNSEALIYTRNHIRESEMPQDELNRYVQIAVDICKEETDVEKSTEMWTEVLETLASRNLDDQIRYVTKQLTESTSVSLPEIIKQLLTQKLETKDLGGSINQACTDLARRSHTWQLFSEIVQKDNLAELLELVAFRKEGWIVSIDGECEICGKKIVGLGVDAHKIYADWVEFMRRISSDDSKADDRSLLFRCKHSYHYSCLTRMSSKGLCIVCYSDD